MDVVNLIVAVLGVGANVAIAYAAFRAIRESQRALKIQAEQFSTQYLQTQEDNRARVRPYLLPVRIENGPPKPYFDNDSFPVHLLNQGFGPAFNISIALYPPGPATSEEQGDPRRCAAFHLPAIGPSDKVLTLVRVGVSSLPGATQLDANKPFSLYAPPASPSRPHPTLLIHAPVVARMTLTYQDADGLKHGAVFDFLDLPGVNWQLVTYLPGITKTLDELSAEHDAKIYRQGLEQMPSVPRLASGAE